MHDAFCSDLIVLVLVLVLVLVIIVVIVIVIVIVFVFVRGVVSLPLFFKLFPPFLLYGTSIPRYISSPIF